jgi:hypothetical protein
MSKLTKTMVVLVVVGLVAGILPQGSARAEETLSRDEIIGLFVAVARDIQKQNGRMDKLERMIVLVQRWMEITDKQLDALEEQQQLHDRALAAVIIGLKQQERGAF